MQRPGTLAVTAAIVFCLLALPARANWRPIDEPMGPSDIMVCTSYDAARAVLLRYAHDGALQSMFAFFRFVRTGTCGWVNKKISSDFAEFVASGKTVATGEGGSVPNVPTRAGIVVEFEPGLASVHGLQKDGAQGRVWLFLPVEPGYQPQGKPVRFRRQFDI